MNDDTQQRHPSPRIMLTFEPDQRDGFFTLTIRHGYAEGSREATKFEQAEDKIWRAFRNNAMTRLYQAGRYPATNIPEMYENRQPEA